MKLTIHSNQMEEVEGLRNEYPYAYHDVDLNRTAIPWHWHEAIEFGYIRQGSLQVSTVGQSLSFHKGEGFFINSNTLTAMANSGECILESHLFHPVFLGGHFKSVFETKYINPVIQNRNLELLPIRAETPVQKQLLRKLQQLSQLQAQPDTEFQTRNLLSEIWLLLLEEIKDNRTLSAPGKNQDRILTMLSFIHNAYSQKLTLEDIADVAAISTRECLRCFRESIRQSPMDYLIHYRIRMAKKLLETTGLTITEIALQCGFNSTSYFTKQFHQICGKSPNAYRKELASLQKNAVAQK